jgi:hypothetical protein
MYNKLPYWLYWEQLGWVPHPDYFLAQQQDEMIPLD